MSHKARYNLLDHRRNEDILEELEVDPVEKKSSHCEQKWLIMLSGWKTTPKTTPCLSTYQKRMTWTTNKETTGRTES
jgi:hypothetical protein